MHMITDYAHAEGVHAIEGPVLRENTTMLAMCKELVAMGKSGVVGSPNVVSQPRGNPQQNRP
jgi:hypothetical protein